MTNSSPGFAESLSRENIPPVNINSEFKYINSKDIIKAFKSLDMKKTADLHAKYSALLEPVVNALQSIALDVVKASQHVKRILQLLKSHRDNPERVTDEIIKDATVVAEKVGLEEDITSMPRIVGKQRHRSNHPAESPS
ncbi:hypothetical protein EVAR_95689_1 [Eumeta japonica]|uniref:Uncharacterized protein n=1 Tax=Eumeta variegata TaxID=151549 RepID=A0A4C1VK05_EUMVA|nr:hypothetical protein EVAR_95689_1 [Eumeta japonica]